MPKVNKAQRQQQQQQQQQQKRQRRTTGEFATAAEPCECHVMVFPLNIRPQSSDAHNNNRFLSQNIALAKKTSFLMSKIAGLESKISELIQENIDLRALNAKNEDSKRRNLEEKLSVIEEGVAQRFEDMLQMFTTIRQNEGLPPSQISIQNLLRNISNDPSTSTFEKTVSFDNVDSPKKNAKSERRRKSARRQSIYIAPPSPPQQQETQQSGTSEESQPHGQNAEDLVPVKQVHPQLPSSTAHQTLQTLTFPMLGAPSGNEIPVHFDESNPFDEQSQYEDTRHSLNEFLIPEEEGDDDDLAREADRNGMNDDLLSASSLSPIKIAAKSSPQKRDSRSNFHVFEDTPEPEETQQENLEDKIQRLAKEAVRMTSPKKQKTVTTSEVTSGTKKSAPKRVTRRTKKIKEMGVRTVESEDAADDMDSDEHKPLKQDTSKIKHTKRKSQDQKSKSTTDEKMPESMSPDDELLESRSRRATRGKRVSYTEPSLSVKMRRQSEKFVDAAGEDAFDAFIRPSSRSATAKDEFSAQEIRVEVSEEKIVEATMNHHLHKVTTTDQYIEASRDSPIRQNKPLTIQDNVNITKRRKPLAPLSRNKLQKIDDQPFQKFEGLSVFDLVEESSVGVPKTYKNKPDITTKRRNSTERRYSSLI